MAAVEQPGPDDTDPPEYGRSARRSPVLRAVGKPLAACEWLCDEEAGTGRAAGRADFCQHASDGENRNVARMSWA